MLFTAAAKSLNTKDSFSSVISKKATLFTI